MYVLMEIKWINEYEESHYVKPLVGSHDKDKLNEKLKEYNENYEKLKQDWQNYNNFIRTWNNENVPSLTDKKNWKERFEKIKISQNKLKKECLKHFNWDKERYQKVISEGQCVLEYYITEMEVI